MKLIIEAGRKFILDKRTIVYRGFNSKWPQPYHFVDVESGYPITMTADEIETARERDQLADWRPDSIAVIETGKVCKRTWVTTSTATDAEMQAAARKQDYINAWVANPVKRSARNLVPLIDSTFERRLVEARGLKRYEPNKPSVRTYQKVIQDFRERGGVLDAMVPQTRRRGNYRQRLSRTVMGVVGDAIDTEYLRRNGPSVAELHRSIVKRIALENRKRGHDQLGCPSLEAVARAVRNLCRYTTMFCREGKEKANKTFRMVGGGFVTDRANEVWEIDDTRVDLICLSADGKTVIGRPWMIIVIDRHTRMIMSFILTFAPPNTEAVLEAIRTAILNKENFYMGEPSLGEKWPARGRPEEIHVDNAKHYNSLALERGLRKLYIRLKTMPVLKPWYKATVERLIGTVMRQVFHTVPGTTYSNIFQRDDETPPETVAKTTLAEAQEKLLLWVVNEYQHRHHRGIDDTPYRMWCRSTEEGMQLHHTTEQVNVALSPTEVGKLDRGGIVVDGLRYITADGLRMEMAPLSRSATQVVVRRNHGNLEYVDFLDPGVTDPELETWHRATVCEAHFGKVNGRTLEQFHLARALQKECLNRNEAEQSWAHYYDLVETKQQNDIDSHRLADRTRAEGEKEKTLNQAARREVREGQAGRHGEQFDLQAQLEALDMPTTKVPPFDANRAPGETIEQFRDRFKVGVRGPIVE